MQLAGISSATTFSNLRFRQSYSRSVSSGSGARDHAADRVALRDLFGDLDRLRDEIEGLEKEVSGIRRGRKGGGIATSSSNDSLGLDLVSTFASMRSTEEINADTTSFSPTDPSFNGASSASPTIGGSYDGSQGDDTLTFTVTSGGVVGLGTPISLEVRDSLGGLVDTVSYGAFDPAGTVVTLSNGLEVSLSSGTVVDSDSFEVVVSNSTQNAFDPDLTFAEGPGFESGTTIQDGSFTINGVDITVNTTDTLNDVLARISASAAGVDASFDTDTETVVLIAQSAGSAGDFSIGPDSSGLVQALKLDGADLDRGQDDERSLALDQVAAFASVTSGNFLVNGTSISIDTSVDSLNDILARIESQVPTVEAYFHSGSGKVRIQSTQAGSPLSLGDGSSGFISALDLDTGTQSVEPGVKKLSGVDSAEIALRFESIADRLSDVLERRDVVNADIASGSLRTRLITSLGEVFRDQKLRDPIGSRFETGFGIDLDLQFKAEKRVSFDLDEFRSAVSQKGSALLRFLEGDGEDRPGLLGALGAAVDATERSLVEKYGSDAHLLDVLA